MFLYGNAWVGPWMGGRPLAVKATFADSPFKVPSPRVVLLQPRQFDNNDFRYPDQFAVMVNETAESYIRFTVTRIDTFQRGAGWGQNLMVDVFVVDDGTAPTVDMG